MKKIISSIMLCIFLFSLLFTMGCAKETTNSPIVQRDDKVVFSFRGKTVTESEFGYYLSLYKGYELFTFLFYFYAHCLFLQTKNP